MKHNLSALIALDIPYDTEDTTHFGDYRIKVRHDDDHEDPREWGSLGTMSCFHSRYNLGDKHNYNDSRDLMFDLSGLYEEESTWEYLTDEQLQRCTDAVHKKYIMLPLYLHDHSGISMNTGGFSCGWDSGQVGYIYVSLEKVRKEYDVKRVSKKMRERIEGYLRDEVKTYDMYLTGEVYGFMVEREDPDGEVVDVDACWGFYGYNDAYMINEIKSYIKYDIEQTPQQMDLI